MKRLKYSCPFGGRRYPFVLATVLPLVVGFALAFHGNAQLMMSAILLLPVVVLVVCFWIEQYYMTPDEKEIVDATEPPLWQPITQDLQERIRAKERPLENSPMIMILCCCGSFVASFFVFFGCNGISVALAGMVTLIVLIRFLVCTHRLDIWSQVDDTAVYIEVPIHHMYDVRYTSKRRRLFFHYNDDCDVWYVSYLVFYLHNGRYTLRVPPGGGYAHSVVILKFQDHICWLLQ